MILIVVITIIITVIIIYGWPMYLWGVLRTLHAQQKKSRRAGANSDSSASGMNLPKGSDVVPFWF